MLRELGFTTLTANDGREAVELFKQNPEIAFVILDLTMPKMDGEQCFQELHKIKPDLRVFISSGFSEHEVSHKFINKGLAGFIQKPYKLSALRDAVKLVPHDQLLVETDSPFLAPSPHRGALNTPAQIANIVRAMAAERNEDVAELATALSVNAERIFGSFA
jgi:Tat protein secretion system quality control protein TatD with DNase activity